MSDGPKRVGVASGPDAIRTIRRLMIEGGLPDLYVSEGNPVHIERVSGTVAQAVDDDSPLPVRASVLTGPLLASLLAHHVHLQMASTNEGWKEWTPGTGILSAVLAAAEWPEVPALAGIVGLPVIRRDGTLLQEAGYDPGTGLYLAPKVAVDRVPVAIGPDARPSPADVDEARVFILEQLLADFEWRSPADRANYLGLLVTPILRRYLRCLTPFGIISASMPGSGKSILSGLLGLLAGQKTLPWADDDHELRKAITSAFTAEAGATVFDNLEEGTVIKSPILANLLTNPVWSDRILGSTKIGSWLNERVWLANGNNLRVGGDMASRSVLVQLMPRSPHPEERTGFSIPDLDTWILAPANQAAVLRALLVLILDWVAAGADVDHTVPSMRQFTPWCRGIGGFLRHHGVGGFLANLGALRELDEDDQKWAAFLAMWQRRLGSKQVRAREVFEDAALDEIGGHGQLDPWDGLFITSPRGGRPRTAVQLGQWLAGHAGRYHGTLRLESIYDTHAKVTLWRVTEWQANPNP